MRMRVAGSQIGVTADIDSNVSKIIRAIDFACNEKADILLTPEGSLSGYTQDFDPVAVEEALAQVTSAACAKKVGLALGTCFVEDDAQCYNQVRFYLPDGAYLGFHSKILRCGNLQHPQSGEINFFAPAALRTFEFCGITVGALICNDLWANPGCTPMPDPHLSQQLAKMGARIIFHAVNGGRAGDEWSELSWQYHEANLRMRAQAGGVWVVTVDNCNPTHLCCSAPSGVIDPQGDRVYRTEVRGEQFFAYSIELPDANQ